MTTVKIPLKNYGQVFSSRPEGREAASAMIAYHLKDGRILGPGYTLTIDFEGVLIMTPSWLSEFLQTIKKSGIQNILFENTQNKSVSSSIEAVEHETGG